MVYMAFKDFYSYRKVAGTNISDFLVHYEFLYQRLQKFEITLLERVQAFFVANISEENEKLTRATCGILTYTSMKGTLKKVFATAFWLLKRKWKW